MHRVDLSTTLVHWIKGDTDEDAFEIMCKIVNDHCLRGGSGYIKGGYECVCFTETPHTIFHAENNRYRHFGVSVSKRWLFSQGGRPVIYQRDNEFEALPESHKWRHVRFEPDLDDSPTDFSWEREWRIHTSALTLPPSKVRLLLPDEDWGDALKAEHAERGETCMRLERMAYGDELLIQQPEPFPYEWDIID